MAGPSLGQGIALQERLKFDDTPNRVIENAMARRQERDRQDEKELVDVLDFKVDYGKYLPVYGNEIAKVQAEIYNNYAKYRQQDKGTARQRIQMDIMGARQKIGELARSNDALKHDMALGPDFLKDNNFLQLAVGRNTTFDQLQKASHPLGYYGVDQYGGYSSMPVKTFKSTDPFTAVDISEEIYTPAGKQSDVPGKKLQGRRTFVADEVILAKAQQRAADPGFKLAVLHDRPDLYSEDKNVLAKNILDAALIDVQRFVPKTKTEEFLADLPNPPSGSGDKKLIRPTITRDIEQMDKVLPEGTMKKTKNDEGKDWYQYVDKNGNVIGEGKDNETARNTSLKPGTGKVDLLVNLPDAKVMSVRTSPEMIDMDTNNFMKNTGSTTTFDFKPTRLQTMRMKDGSIKVYAVGKAVQNVEAEGRKKDTDPKKTENVYNVAVPYAEIRSGLVDEGYDLGEFDLEYQKLVAGGGQRSAAPAPQRAKNPKTGEIVEYINGQWVPVK